MQHLNADSLVSRNPAPIVFSSKSSGRVTERKRGRETNRERERPKGAREKKRERERHTT